MTTRDQGGEVVPLHPAPGFLSPVEAARYLDRLLDALPERPDSLANDVALWSWLSVFYFDQVCPTNDKGKRKPGRDYRHILEPGYPAGHRHLLAGAYLVYTVYGWGESLARLTLHTRRQSKAPSTTKSPPGRA